MADAGMLFLIGMPGAGKTHWGKLAAQEFHWQFADLDKVIESKERTSIPSLFAEKGEAGFREIEHNWLSELIMSNTEDTIVACGGGTPCFYDNIQLMKKAGPLIYLQADPLALLDNLNKSPEVRPLLQSKGNIADQLEDMLKKRKQFYEQADFILHAKDISIATFAQIITSCINRH